MIKQLVNKIKDITNYNPTELSDTVLVDDYRLMLAYYSKYKEDPEGIKFTRIQIKDTLTLIIKEMLDRSIEFHPDSYTDSSREIFEEILEDLNKEEIIKIQQPFGYPCGKWLQRNKFLKYLPDDCEVYVEPYVGGGAVFWSHDKEFKKEILNDLDKDVYDALKFIKSMTADECKDLLTKSWAPSKKQFAIVLDREPTNRVDKFYRFLYTNMYSFGRGRKTYSPYTNGAKLAEGRIHRIYNTCRPRLKEVEILNKDGVEVIKQYDKDNVIFFIDPPYPGQVPGFESSTLEEFDMKRLSSALEDIKGKFILTLNDTKDNRELFKSHHIISHNIPNNANNIPGTLRGRMRKELIITNFADNVAKISQQERLTQLEETEGSWYLVEEDGKPNPFVVQYHVRGIVHEIKDIEKIFEVLKNNKLEKAKELLSNHIEKLNPESNTYKGLLNLLEEDDINKFFSDIFKELEFVIIDTPLSAVSESVQKVDDKRGNVSAALKKFIDSSPPKLDSLDLSKVYNIGNIHVDWRMKDPSGDYLVGITMDTVKIAIQDLDDEIHYILRDRFLENKEGDNWLSQKKLRQPYPVWLKVVTPKDPVWSISPQSTGATIETAGRYFFKASGHGYWGCSKSDFNEIWLYFDQDKYKSISGRFDFKLIQTPKDFTKVPDDAFWMMNRPYKSQMPYITTHDKEKEEAKAKKDKVDIVWNEDLLNAKELKHFKKVDKQAIYKVDKMKRIVIGAALIPGEPDYSGDILSEDEIEKIAYNYIEDSRKAGLMHEGESLDNVVLVESRILRKQEIQSTPFGTVIYPKGTWELGFKIKDNAVWEQVLKGELTGFSIQGVGYRSKRS